MSTTPPSASPSTPAFIVGLQRRLGESLARLERALAGGTTGGVSITTRRGEPWISCPVPARLARAGQPGCAQRRGRAALGHRRAVGRAQTRSTHLTGFTDEFTSVASREITDRTALRRRLLLVLFALGTNMGIKQVIDSAGDDHVGDTEAALRRVRRLWVNRENLRRAVIRLVNATLATRDTGLVGTRAQRAPRTRRSSAPGHRTS